MVGVSDVVSLVVRSTIVDAFVTRVTPFDTFVVVVVCDIVVDAVVVGSVDAESIAVVVGVSGVVSAGVDGTVVDAFVTRVNAFDMFVVVVV